ncbi:hypothetical protein ACLK17_24675 [Escherichia coli]
MKPRRSRLMATRMAGSAPERRRTAKPEGLLTQNEELSEPLYACHQSLQACGVALSRPAICSTPCAA